MLLSINILDKMYNDVVESNQAINNYIVDSTDIVSKNLLLDAIPNEPANVFEGESIAFSKRRE